MDSSQNPVRDQSANPSSNPLYYDLSSENPLLGMGIQQPFPSFTSAFHAAPSTGIPHMDWNPCMMLDNLTFIEEKIRQVKDVIRSMVDNGGQLPGELLQQQQQLVNTDLTCLIVQLISTAGSLLPSLKNSSFLSHPTSAGQTIDNLAGSSSSLVPNAVVSDEHKEEIGSPDYEELLMGFTDGGVEEGITIDNTLAEEHDAKDGGGDGGAMDRPTGSYELLQLERDEILAPHTHFCSICGKGFKRDANLRMHMRGHGDEYKSPAALAKPPRDTSADEEHATAVMKRYSCPFAGCKRNKDHSSFQPLKTFLCVRNHYKRSHCEKRHTCGRCHTKKFSVMADLKTHEKHCGMVRWVCSCGTSFSRKDKLFSHVALFKGHSPALLPPAVADDHPAVAEVSDQVGHADGQPPAKVASSMAVGSSTFIWGTSNIPSSSDIKGLNGGGSSDIKGLNGGGSSSSDADDFLSTANFGSFNFGFGQLDSFPGDPCSEGSLEMLSSEHYQSFSKQQK